MSLLDGVQLCADAREHVKSFATCHAGVKKWWWGHRKTCPVCVNLTNMGGLNQIARLMGYRHWAGPPVRQA